jgi:ABC-type branched-subunit amino acid transport system permease subunit
MSGAADVRRASGAAPMRSRLLAYAPILVAAALLALVPLRYHESGSTMRVLTEGMLFAAYAVAFNVIFGSTGQLFLCIGALAGVGGFMSAIFTDRVGLPMMASIGVGVAMAAAVGGLLSWIAVKRALGTIFIGIVTLAFSLSFDSLLLGRSDLFGGEAGLRVDAGSDTILRDRLPPYFIFLALVVVYLVIFRMLQRSRTGWAFRALRDDMVAAELAGVDVARYRVYAGLLGSAMLGLAGALYAFSGNGLIGRSTYEFGRVDVRVIVILAFGGIGSLLGPVVGAAAFTWLDEFLIEYREMRLMIYGFVIIALFLGFRRGVVPTVIGWSRRSGQRPPVATGQASASEATLGAGPTTRE